MKLIYWYLKDCAVCSADEENVAALAARYAIAFEKRDMNEDLAEASQRLIFTAPTVTLMDGERELHRQASIIDFLMLEKHLERASHADH